MVSTLTCPIYSRVWIWKSVLDCGVFSRGSSRTDQSKESGRRQGEDLLTPLLMSIAISRQDACFVDNRIVSGSTVKVHFVVKRTPFAVILEGHQIDFNKGKLMCELLLDTPERPVVDGVEFVARPSSEGRCCALDLRILLLSSQCTASGFRVRITHSDGKRSCSVVTEPIVAVAKQQQVRPPFPTTFPSFSSSPSSHSIPDPKSNEQGRSCSPP